MRSALHDPSASIVDADPAGTQLAPSQARIHTARSTARNALPEIEICVRPDSEPASSYALQPLRQATSCKQSHQRFCTPRYICRRCSTPSHREKLPERSNSLK